VETERNREKRKQQSKMDDRTQNENLPKDIPNNEKVLIAKNVNSSIARDNNKRNIPPPFL
jgi:hypothetical protein